MGRLPSGNPSLTTTSRPSPVALSQEIKERAWTNALWVLGDPDRSYCAVARAAYKLPLAAASQADRVRKRKKKDSPDTRQNYRVVLGPDNLFEFLALYELSQEEKQQEKGFCLEQVDLIKRSSKQPTMFALHHNPFIAAVGTFLFNSGYKASELQKIFVTIDPDRAVYKGDSACSVAKATLMTHMVTRFGSVAEIERKPNRPPRQKGQTDEDKATDFDLVYHRATEEEARWAVETQARFAPSGTPNLIPPGYPKSPIPFSKDEDQADVERIAHLVDPVRASSLASGCGLARFDARIQVPSPRPSNDNKPPLSTSSTSTDTFDADHLDHLIQEELEKRRRFLPGSLLVRVDGIDRCQLLEDQRAIELLLERDAALIEIVGTTLEGESLVVACCILTYDEPKEEIWEVNLPDCGTVTCQLDYDENDCASARFVITPASLLERPPLVKVFFITDASESSSFAKLEPLFIGMRSSRPTLDFFHSHWLWIADEKPNRNKNDQRARQRAGAALQKLMHRVTGRQLQASWIRRNDRIGRVLRWLYGGAATLLGTAAIASIYRHWRSIARGGLSYLLEIAAVSGAFATLCGLREFSRIIRRRHNQHLDLKILAHLTAPYEVRTRNAVEYQFIFIRTRCVDHKTPIAVARSLVLLAEGTLRTNSGSSLLRYGTKEELEQVFYQFGGQREVPLLVRSIVKNRPIDNFAQVLREFEQIVPASEIWNFLRARLENLTIREE